MPHRERPDQRLVVGFTLMEVAVCLVLLGLLAGVVVLSLEETRQRATWASVVERVTAADAHCRDTAERLGRPVTLVLDLEGGEGGTLRRGGGESDSSPVEAGGSGLWRMPPRYRLVSLRVQGQAEEVYRQTAIPFSLDGRSPTYAVQVEGPRRETRWLLVAGQTGRVTEFDHEESITSILETLQTHGGEAWPDAG